MFHYHQIVGFQQQKSSRDLKYKDFFDPEGGPAKPVSVKEDEDEDLGSDGEEYGQEDEEMEEEMEDDEEYVFLDYIQSLALAGLSNNNKQPPPSELVVTTHF